jgi:cyclopropane-fatty-acyl-phospholipid synthase
MSYHERFFNFPLFHGHSTSESSVQAGALNLKERCQRILNHADIKIDGSRPWDLQIRDDRFYARVLSEGSMGLGESYMDGWWDAEALDEFFFRIFRTDLAEQSLTWRDKLSALKARIINQQKISRAFQIGRHHYDLGNDLYRTMLDRQMIYSCGYWQHASTLDQAQEAKLDLICRKLQLKPSMRLLDIGCGWGGMAAYAARNYGVEVVGITVSEEQARFAREQCRGLPVTIELCDYRKQEGTFDRVVSIGMFEHVGYKNYRTYMQQQKSLLTSDGLALLHTIGRNKTAPDVDKWISRYIFPNSMLPSAKQLSCAAEGLFVIEDWHSFGTDYDTTLMHWFRNFDDSFDTLPSSKYDQRFYRMWKYYLLSCAGSFRARRNQVWQLVLSPQGCLEGYHAPR